MSVPADADPVLWLDRLTWGVNDSVMADWRKLGPTQWLMQQLAVDRPAVLPLPVRQVIGSMAISKEPTEALIERMESARVQARAAGPAELQLWQKDMRNLADEATIRMMLRAVHSDQQLQERMNWFWLNHFSVLAQGDVRMFAGDFDQALRPLALGRFRELLGVATLHPAMLIYLNNDRNVLGHINENLARELMELHTLGVDGGYSQADVEALARVLTGLGWSSISRPGAKLRAREEAGVVTRGAMRFVPARHDGGDKLLLGQKVAGGGMEEIEGVLDRLARHPATARHVCRKLAMYWVSDTPSESLVKQLSDRFVQTDGHIREVLAELFSSTEFKASLGHKFKEPLQYTLSALRQLVGQGGVVTNGQPVRRWLDQLGQLPFGRTTPDGYSMQVSAWNGSGQFTQRFEVARQLSRSLVQLAQAPAAMPVDASRSDVSLGFESETFDKKIRPRLSANTVSALDQVKTAPERAALWWSAPEFMNH